MLGAIWNDDKLMSIIAGLFSALALVLLGYACVQWLIQRPVFELVKLFPVLAVFEIDLQLRFVVMRIVSKLEQIVFIGNKLPARACDRKWYNLRHPV